MTTHTQISGPKELARFVDYALLRADATKEDVARVCAGAREHGVGCVCVNSSRVAQAYHLLEDSSIKVVAAIAFPLGAMDADAKRYETEAAADNDAHVIEVVVNVGRLKDGDRAYVLRELRDVVEAADDRPVGVVIETALLTREEIEAACELAVESGAKTIVTSTGFHDPTVTVEDVQSIKRIVGEKFGIKAGGIRDATTALAMIEAGATRIGTTDINAILKG
jgi:deoxyribose-phosphate aldolase